MRDEAREAGHQRAVNARPVMGDNGGPTFNEDEAREAIAQDIADLGDDLHALVMYLFPWGEEDGPLATETGPDVWQRDHLDAISKRLQNLDGDVIREGTVSGHGIGKSAVVAWLIIALLISYPDSRGRVTANTDVQLRNTTWAEVSKWFEMLNPILKAQFTYTATAIYSNAPGHEKTWRVDAVPWSKHNPAAFAGLHNAGKRVFIVMDEASEIADVIWDTVEGATTDADTEIILAVYGNPTQPVGRFREVIDGQLKTAQGWNSRHIDSRTVKRTNRMVLDKQISAWGEDSDFARIRIKGEFPRTGMTQLIPADLVQAARLRPALYNASDPLILGVDVARYGQDSTVLCPRRGKDARTLPWEVYQGKDTMFVANAVVLYVEKYGVDAVMIDVGGVGAGVYDRVVELMQQRPHVSVFPVDFGGAGGWVDYQGTKIAVANKRAAMWATLLEWLRIGAALPNDQELGAALERELIAVQYSFVQQTKIILEAKEMMHKRGLPSPDHADALACTFAYPVLGRVTERTHSRDLDHLLRPQSGVSAQEDYDPHRDLPKDW